MYSVADAEWHSAAKVYRPLVTRFGLKINKTPWFEHGVFSWI